MGFFKNLKAGIEAAQAASAQSEPLPVFLDPLPQAEVDRLLQSGSPVVRAIVFRKWHQVVQKGERIGRMKVELEVRPRGPKGTLGDPVKLKASLSSLTASLIAKGLDIPVERDPATGALTRVASAQLTDELAHRSAEAEKLNPHAAWDSDIEGMIDVAQAVGRTVRGEAAPAPVTSPPSVSDPRRQPVEGISWETFVAVSAHLEQLGGEADAVAQTYGVRASTWPAISNVWLMRTATDADLAAMYVQDLEAAKKKLTPPG